ncbi:hypothetical protein ACN27G_16250 [Plantactinospora sp. WMMB334]|uniref:hypothetical protein n=1 Tax=Plantactinospora sp. WMMB334 TaxID=3404119 RepID=UPI003B9259F6
MLDTVTRPDQGRRADPPGQPVTLAGPEPVILVPVVRGGSVPRPIGAWVLTHGTVRYRPAVDLREVLGAAVLVAAVTAVAVTRRRPPAVGAIRMGHGGWVSLKGVPAPALTAGRRPWWARVLRARRLVVERPTRRPRMPAR